MKDVLAKVKPYGIAIVAFIVLSVAYFSPILEGKKLFQNDIRHFIGMAKEVNDFRTENHAEPYWTNAAFSGMPTYNLSAKYPYAFLKKIDQTLRFLPRPADYVFLYFLSFFILLLILKIDVRVAFLGALAFGFSTYYIIILGVGHNAKAHAIAYMPMVLGGMLLALRGKWLWGFVLTALAMGLEIQAGHPQMTYYLGFAVLILGIVYGLEALKNKTLKQFFLSIGILLVAVSLAVGMNATNLLATKEYVEHSTRGKTELTINPDGTPREALDGLSKTYITEYSYGIVETFNLFISRFQGGGNYEDIGTDSNTYKFLSTRTDPRQARQFVQFAPMYWGQQPIVEAPAYIGAILIFLFVLGIFIVKGKLKRWLVAVTLFSILLSWGKNASLITNFFIEYVPLYNKFRAVSSIQVLAELAVPLLGVLGLSTFISNKIPAEQKLIALKKTLYITGGLALFFVVAGTSLFNFEGLRDTSYDQMLPGLLDAIIADRKVLFFKDSLRTTILIGLSAGTLWLYLKSKIKSTPLIAILGLLILFDLIGVNRRYLNSDNFQSANQIDKPFKANQIDAQILEDKSYYRVGNFAGDLMNDGGTSYFHKSIGGYHAAKLGKYQDLFEFQIAKNNIEVLNMLNTKYLMFEDGSGNLQAQLNTDANGNAWFIQKLKIAETADDELIGLDSLRTKSEAIIRSSAANEIDQLTYESDTTATISLTSYKANELVYESISAKKQFAVFSEIYYKDGWNAYINGEPSPYYNVNYVLRGMPIPSGKHTITFRFEPTVIKWGSQITLISYMLFLLVPGIWFFVAKKRRDVS